MTDKNLLARCVSAADYLSPTGPHDLYHLTPYVHWASSSDEITLDGEFTVEELEALAKHMREHADG